MTVCMYMCIEVRIIVCVCLYVCVYVCSYLIPRLQESIAAMDNALKDQRLRIDRYGSVWDILGIYAFKIITID